MSKSSADRGDRYHASVDVCGAPMLCRPLSRYVLALVCSLLLWLGAAPAQAQSATPADLQAILATRAIAVEALNTKDFSKVVDYLHPDFTLTTVDNQVFHSAAAFETYWNQQFENQIETIAMTVADDTDRVFLSPEIEVAYGQATATFTFTSGLVRDMTMRWTAVLTKAPDKWLLQSLHFSANLLDNPVLNAAQASRRVTAIATGLGGLIIGTVIAIGITKFRF